MATLIEIAKANGDQPRPILSVVAVGEGYIVKLSCGHASSWTTPPANGSRHYCPQCLDALLEHLRNERHGGRP